MIAEGHGKFTYKDKINYCLIARGSLNETWNHLIDAYDLNYISRQELKEYKLQIDENGKLLNGYITFLRSMGEREKINKQKA